MTVSHDRAFLDAVTEETIVFREKQLIYHAGERHHLSLDRHSFEVSLLVLHVNAHGAWPRALHVQTSSLQLLELLSLRMASCIHV